MATPQVKRQPSKKASKLAKNPVKIASQKASDRKGLLLQIRQRINDFLVRRPHRSFRLTRHRDYQRSLKLPGYWVFTLQVLRLVRENKKILLSLAVVYAVMNIALLGIASQDQFTDLQGIINETGQEVFQGNWGKVGTAVLLAMSTVSGNISPTLTDAQQIYAVILGLLVWLTVVWILRQRMAGHRVKLRDGLYNAGSPIVATGVVALVLALQLIPIALAVIGYVAAQSTGLLNGGVEAMLFWISAAGLATLSIYWITSSAVALVVVTLPGMYPFRALKIAGDLVIGRRLRIMYRILWMMLLLVVMWAIILIPVILLDTGIKGLWPTIQWLPVVPVAMTILSTLSIVWTASYVYVLYRRIVDDDAKPA